MQGEAVSGLAGMRREFATTHWSVVLTAAQPESPQATAALEELCRTYWYPLYAYVRRRGFTREGAQDLTQAFFEHLLRKEFLRSVRPEKGRFRSFLLACLKHYLADEWERTRAAKRGGDRAGNFLDLKQAEERYRVEGSAETDAERLYQRRWALEILERVLERLRAEAVASGNGARFDQLQGCLLGKRPPQSYAELGAGLGMSVVAVKVSIHRLRHRFREALREEIAHTVTRPEEIEEEMHCLFEVVSR
jgi:RNA polymerase sigma factor (sigma-70 family)